MRFGGEGLGDGWGGGGGEGLFVGCLTSQQHACVSQGRTCSDNLTCCHAEIEVVGQIFHLTQSQYTDTGPTSPSTDPITPGAWQVATGMLIYKSLVWLDPEKNPGAYGIRTRDLPLSRRTPWPLGQRGGGDGGNQSVRFYVLYITGDFWWL